MLHEIYSSPLLFVMTGIALLTEHTVTLYTTMRLIQVATGTGVVGGEDVEQLDTSK